MKSGTIFFFAFMFSCSVGSAQNIKIQYPGNPMEVLCSDITQDGKLLALGDWQGAMIWDVQSKKLLHRFSGISNGASQMWFTPDGKKLLTVGFEEPKLRVWDVETETLLHISPIPPGSFIQRIVFSPDSKFAGVLYSFSPTAFSNDEIRVLEVRSGKQIKTLQFLSPLTSDMTLSADGKNLVLQELSVGMLWSLKSFSFPSLKRIPITQPERDSQHPRSFRIHCPAPGSEMLTTFRNSGTTVETYDLKTGKLSQKEFDGSFIALSKNGEQLFLLDTVFSVINLRSEKNPGYVIPMGDDVDREKIFVHNRDADFVVFCTREGISVHEIKINASGFQNKVVIELDSKSSNFINVGSTAVKFKDEFAIVVGNPSYTFEIKTDSVWQTDSLSASYGTQKRTTIVALTTAESDKRLLGTQDSTIEYSLNDVGMVSSVSFPAKGKSSGTITVKMPPTKLHGEFSDVNASGTLLATTLLDNIGFTLWTVKGEEVLTLRILDEKNWIAIQPSGKFDASPLLLKSLYFVEGNSVIPLEKFKARFYQPGLLQDVLIQANTKVSGNNFRNGR